MNPKTRNAAWYGFGVFASLSAALFMSDGSERIPAGDPILFGVAAFWSFILSVIFLVYGSISEKIRFIDLSTVSHFLPLFAGLLYSPMIFGLIEGLGRMSAFIPVSIREGSLGTILGIVLLFLPVLCFELNRFKTKNEKSA